jgi:hypothetical protein
MEGFEMKKEFAISYQKNWDSLGTCYRQCVNLKRETFEKLKDNVLCEIALLQAKYKKEGHIIYPDNEKLMYLSVPLEKRQNTVFMNLTQRDLFNKFLHLKLLDRNTMFYIIN